MNDAEKYNQEIEKLNQREEKAQAEINVENSKKGAGCWVLGSTVLVLSLWFSGLFFPKMVRYLQSVTSTENELTNWGLTGDSFGVVNALFSGLAFAFVIVAIVLQSRELKLQRLEMKLSLIESERSRLEQIRIAESQRMSERRLKEQADQMFLSSYLNVLQILVDKHESMYPFKSSDTFMDTNKNLSTTIVQLQHFQQGLMSRAVEALNSDGEKFIKDRCNTIASAAREKCIVYSHEWKSKPVDSSKMQEFENYLTNLLSHLAGVKNYALQIGIEKQLVEQLAATISGLCDELNKQVKSLKASENKFAAPGPSQFAKELMNWKEAFEAIASKAQ